MLNTLATYSIYVAGLVRRLLAQGGLAAVEQKNKPRRSCSTTASRDRPVHSGVATADRSRMNVVFRLPDEAQDKAFLQGAEARGMVQLKGHRAVGGIRASIYNAMPIEGVQALAAYMREFAGKHA